MREWHPSALIQLEVLARGRRALLVYGLGHFQRKNVHSNFEMEDWRAQTEQWKLRRAEEQFDALLYLGPEDAMTESRWSPSLCSDSAYMNMRLTRIAVSGIPPAEAERLKKYCAKVASK
jgi:hypothetical protein